uniref:Uncharacterized protein n=1 Tax=Globodera pallida TaxID=36090 RepID=A0A183BW45_GLOPA
MRLLPFHCLCIFALIIQQNSLSDQLQCFLCEGPCNCQGHQLSQKCVPNDRFHHPRCYSVKSVLTGQVLRKGCSADCESVEVSGWQKCQLCEGQMCNKNDDDVSKTFLLNDCQMSQFFGALQTIRHLAESSQFVNGIDSSLFASPKNKVQMAKTENKNDFGAQFQNIWSPTVLNLLALCNLGRPFLALANILSWAKIWHKKQPSKRAVEDPPGSQHLANKLNTAKTAEAKPCHFWL